MAELIGNTPMLRLSSIEDKINAVAAIKGYEAIIVMPDTMGPERQRIIAAYGAKIVLSDGTLGMSGAIELAKRLQGDTPNSIITGKFENPSNPATHYDTTGPEIFEDMDGAVNVFVSAVGTGGTISGVGRCLKEKIPTVKVVAVEPKGSPYLSKGIAGKHGIQGIGAGFTPATLDTEIYATITDHFFIGRIYNGIHSHFRDVLSDNL